ncbi:uncharacterized protein TNCV_4817231 [Trichonephila clavipes]|nr:uncharacterized protein TNCV_4817231 [Trichonephila clavipes]
MVNARLVYQLEKNECIPLFQSGFRKGRSTLDNIITLENKIRNAFVRRNHLVSIFFDIEKAYDRTWRYGILRTLFNFGLRGNLPTFIKNFLTLRTFRASLYVDDLQISCGGSDMRLIERQLQTAVNNIVKWCDTNGHSISASKSCCVHFCRKRSIHPDAYFTFAEEDDQVIDSLRPCLDKEPVLPRSNVNEIAANTRFLILSFSNNDMSKQSPFAIHKALIGIGGEPNSVKRLRSGDLLIETNSALQTKSFLLAKSFLDSPITISPHKTLNSCRGVISESDLLITPDAEILDGFSDQGVIQVRRITIKKDNSVIPTKHLILTFNRPKLPTTIKAGYLNCKIRPYIPNPLRCFKCQRFGHSQNSCRGQLTCSRCAAVGHSSTDCTLEPKCINCSQIHTADSKLCPKWKTEKEIQAIKTNNNITYVEARKLIVPQTSHTYSQAAKSSNKTSSTQTDENITKIKCPPLELLQLLSSTIRKKFIHIYS